jgi:hypothetical protein
LHLGRVQSRITMGYVIGFLYFAGCYLHWRNIRIIEKAASMLAGDELVAEPINKTVTTLIWPFMALYGLALEIAYGEGDDDEQ